MKRYILTGAPGSGKTTLLHALKNRGYYCVKEAATDIIHNEQSLGIQAPWADPAFIIKVLQLQIQRENFAYTSNAELQLFDRSPIMHICSLCILELHYSSGTPERNQSHYP